MSTRAGSAPTLLLLASLAACVTRGDHPSAEESPALPSPSAEPAGSAPLTGSASPRLAPLTGSASPRLARPAPKPANDTNVLLITVDSLRADMPWAGYPRPIAPAMTAFAQTAVVYERFYSLSSYTAMSLGGLLSGRYPSELPRSGFYFAGYPDSVLFFPELLRDAGVRTLSAQSHFYFDQRSGFRQAFDVYELVPGLGEDHQTDNSITSPQQLALALAMLGDKANVGGRFFAWFHFLDPHDKYQAHAGIEWGHATRDLYDGEVTFTDQHIGKLLEFVDTQEWGKRTTVILSADHGEAFGEHPRYFRHGFELWDEVTHVPFMIRTPGVAPRRVSTPRSAIDVAPTILELYGLPKDPAMQGQSLLAEIRGKDEPARDVILDLPRTTDSDRRRALIRGDLKLIALGDDDAFQLYDLGKDPRESRDAQWQMGRELADLKAAYHDLSARIPSICPLTELRKLRNKKRHRPC